MLIAGNLSDRLGRKRLLLPAMATMTLASLVFALAESVPLLFAGRVLQGLAIGGFLGVGAAFVVDHARAGSKALAAALAGRLLPPRLRPRARPRGHRRPSTGPTRATPPSRSTSR